MAWTLSSKASELCQSLGYHRVGTFIDEPPKETERKQFLFWVAYVLDKSLSLRLGRSSTIQEYDVTLPDPRTSGPETSSTAAFFGLWVIGSRIQGQIYELLYCPEAIALPESTRRSRVQLLEHRLGELDSLTHETSVRPPTRQHIAIRMTFSDHGIIGNLAPDVERNQRGGDDQFLYALGPCSPSVASDAYSPRGSKSPRVFEHIYDGVHPGREGDAGSSSRLHGNRRQQPCRAILDLHELVSVPALTSSDATDKAGRSSLPRSSPLSSSFAM